MTQTVENNNTPKWYIIHVFSTHEQKVKKSLELLIENNNYEDKIFEIGGFEEKIRTEMLKYCELDTFSMVKILSGLKNLVK